MKYGVEIWGWKERKELEKIHERFLKWVLGVKRRIPGYLVREEVQRDLINSRAGNRAWEFEEKLAEGKESILAKMCLRE